MYLSLEVLIAHQFLHLSSDIFGICCPEIFMLNPMFWAFVGRIINLRNKRNMKIGKSNFAKRLLKNTTFPIGRSLTCIYVATMEIIVVGPLI